MSILKRTAFALALAGPVAAAHAQAIPKSQLGSVSQLVGGTRVEIVYRRPVARGRELFGALVPWGRVWTPSADTAVRLTATDAIEINGSKLAAGSYSVWAIPDSASWTLIFNSVPSVFHLRSARLELRWGTTIVPLMIKAVGR